MTATINPNSHSNPIKTGSIFSGYSEKVLREGKIIDDWEQPEDMFLRIVREYTRIEKEVFTLAA